jgi:hypothetical protein
MNVTALFAGGDDNPVDDLPQGFGSLAGVVWVGDRLGQTLDLLAVDVADIRMNVGNGVWCRGETRF